MRLALLAASLCLALTMLALAPTADAVAVTPASNNLKPKPLDSKSVTNRGTSDIKPSSPKQAVAPTEADENDQGHYDIPIENRMTDDDLQLSDPTNPSTANAIDESARGIEASVKGITEQDTLPEVERGSKKKHYRRTRPGYRKGGRKARRRKRRMSKSKKRRRKRRPRSRRPRPKYRPRPPQKRTRRPYKPTRAPPTIVGQGPRTCRCRLVAKAALQCYHFTHMRARTCKLRLCGEKWECLKRGWSRNICMEKFAHEKIELKPGKSNKCRIRKYKKPKSYWVFYRRGPKKTVKPMKPKKPKKLRPKKGPYA